MARTLKIGLVGAGMFGGDVHLRTYAQLQQHGLAPYLGRLGLEPVARELANVDIQFVGLATRTAESCAAKRETYRAQGLDFSRIQSPVVDTDIINYAVEEIIQIIMAFYASAIYFCGFACNNSCGSPCVV